MDIENLTETQKEDILFHFRAATLSLARKWDHERSIELILDTELTDFKLESFASWVGASGPEVSPDDLTFIKWDDVEGILNTNAAVESLKAYECEIKNSKAHCADT